MLNPLGVAPLARRIDHLAVPDGMEVGVLSEPSHLHAVAASVREPSCMHRAMEVADHVHDHLEVVNPHAVGQVVIIFCKLRCEELKSVHYVSVRVLRHGLICHTLVDIGIVPCLCLVISVFPIRRVLDVVHP